MQLFFGASHIILQLVSSLVNSLIKNQGAGIVGHLKIRH